MKDTRSTVFPYPSHHRVHQYTEELTQSTDLGLLSLSPLAWIRSRHSEIEAHHEAETRHLPELPSADVRRKQRPLGPVHSRYLCRFGGVVVVVIVVVGLGSWVLVSRTGPVVQKLIEGSVDATMALPDGSNVSLLHTALPPPVP
jgi:ferric-dicitrate binding protein FerR (iron transport regulator)